MTGSRESVAATALDGDVGAVAAALSSHRRILLFGEMGNGKSTLARALAAEPSMPARCLGADPGTPEFGPPGAVGLAAWTDEGWRLEALEPLCSLDAARFRLPLVEGLRRLADRAAGARLLIDPPGVTRGAAGAELVLALCAALAVDAIALVLRDGEPVPLAQELAASGARLYRIPASPAARRPDRAARERARAARWKGHLQGAREQTLDVDAVRVIGMPPPPEGWPGRQVALLAGGRCLGLGEVQRRDGAALRVRTHADAAAADAVLVRDAIRARGGALHTAPPPPRPRRPHPPEFVERRTPLTVSLGSWLATLTNGVFGDPLLQLHFKHRGRTLLLDLGDAVQVPTRVLHRVSDVFVTHAHFDHVAGFLVLLRSRLGGFPGCRLYGPPGLAGHIEHQVQGIHWDRIGDAGPAFTIAELDGERCRRYRLRVGGALEEAGESSCADGVLRAEEEFRVRAVTLDHRIPVLAYAFESAEQLNVRPDRLDALGLERGPWLGELKRRVRAGDRAARLELPDGRGAPVGELESELVMRTPGRRLVYATDFADTAANRARVVELARRAEVLFCESTFTTEHAAQARATQHLTAPACGEIARAAGVERLAPFHFSRRYEHDPARVYAQLREAFDGPIVA